MADNDSSMAPLEIASIVIVSSVTVMLTVGLFVTILLIHRKCKKETTHPKSFSGNQSRNRLFSRRTMYTTTDCQKTLASLNHVVDHKTAPIPHIDVPDIPVEYDDVFFVDVPLDNEARVVPS